MGELIPHLRDLCFSRNGHQVPEGFAHAFVKLHGEDWRAAQRHWEQIVELVLDTDAVDPESSGARAIRQAVTAAALLLDRTDLRNRCPLCIKSARKGAKV
ncbi:DUF6313 family protein [Micromonospora sp. SL4-19]|uniref:DUF6313 family protein n=1 Tax=Micromonospora sp. SL4-19 TaxID=3399129 RepID=UPI003A4E4E65